LDLTGGLENGRGVAAADVIRPQPELGARREPKPVSPAGAGGMRSASRLVPVAIVVNVCGVLAVVVAHVALVDIWHGEVDVQRRTTVRGR
jgi:hypothetical protein